MPHGLVLLQHRLVALAVFLPDCCPATEVEEELCLVEILLLAGEHIELAECHFSYLMAWNDTCLTRLWTYLTAYAVGIASSDVQKLAAPRSLIVCHRTFHHVA